MLIPDFNWSLGQLQWLFKVILAAESITFSVAAVTTILSWLFLRYYVFRKPARDGKPLVAFFHPNCNDAGGGERVLWCCVRALLEKESNISVIIYASELVPDKIDVLMSVKRNFNIDIDASRISMVHLRISKLLAADSYKRFTLLGQAVGAFISSIIALRAVSPDVFIDTHGAAFTYLVFKLLGRCKIMCYVHFPAVSSDMRQAVNSRAELFNNSDFIARNFFLTKMKVFYHQFFGIAYLIVGQIPDVVLVNSSWTANHIYKVWKSRSRTDILYPPVDVNEFSHIPLEDRRSLIVSVAQYRPEKNHIMQLHAFARLLELLREAGQGDCDVKLVMMGGTRKGNNEDIERFENLKVMARDLGIEGRVSIEKNVDQMQIKTWYSQALIGLHTMKEEHFGIVVVEYQAAGLIALSHRSGGPEMDIVKDRNGLPTGYLAVDEEDYAKAMLNILLRYYNNREDILRIQQNARESTAKYSDEEFSNGFYNAYARLLSVSRPHTPLDHSIKRDGKGDRADSKVEGKEKKRN